MDYSTRELSNILKAVKAQAITVKSEETLHKYPAVHVFWDIENVCGTEKDIVDFVENFKKSVTQRFNLGDEPRFRINVYHNPDDGRQLQRYLESGVSVKKALVDIGVTIVDIASSDPQQADNCIRTRMQEVMVDWEPSTAIIILISGDAGFINVLNMFHARKFKTFLVANFDCMSNHFKQVPWLEIWSFFVIAHGDTRKVEGKTTPIYGLHPRFGRRKYKEIPQRCGDFVYGSSLSFKDVLCK
jgi:hypothetical protein